VQSPDFMQRKSCMRDTELIRAGLQRRKPTTKQPMAQARAAIPILGTHRRMGSFQAVSEPQLVRNPKTKKAGIEPSAISKSTRPAALNCISAG
jgi:hypothetical protein